jgi:hypothetical protein
VGAELFPADGRTRRWTDRDGTAKNVPKNGITIITKSLALCMKKKPVNNQITGKPELCVKFYEICPEIDVPFFFPCR